MQFGVTEYDPITGCWPSEACNEDGTVKQGHIERARRAMGQSWATRDLPKPCAFIQWKGTNVCMDCYCLCGQGFHVDAEFAYAVVCPHCKRRFEMSAMIEMREIPADEAWDGCDPVEVEPGS